MGLLEKSRRKVALSGLSARAGAAMLRLRTETGETGGMRAAGPADPGCGASRTLLDDLVTHMLSRSMLFVYDLGAVPDRDIVLECATRIVGEFGTARLLPDNRMVVLLTHMQNADPELALIQFGKSLVRAHSEAALPPPGTAYPVDPANPGRIAEMLLR